MCCVWLERKHYFNICGYCYSVCSQEAHVFAIYRQYSVFCDRMARLLEGWTLEDGLLLEDMVPGWKDLAGVCRDVHHLIYVRMMELCVCYTDFFVLLYLILCAVKGQFSVVHRRCSVFCHWKAGLPWMTGLCQRTGLQQGHWRVGLWQRAGLHGVQGRTPLDGRSLLKDVVGFFFAGGHFTGRCSELYISLCKYDGVVRVCVV